jgi:hypothetical protein
MTTIQMMLNSYFGNIVMTAGSLGPAAKNETPAESKQIVLKEIGAKWGKFSEQDLSTLKGTDDLVTQVVSKYGLEKAQAQRDVDALLKGRQI